MTKSAAPVIFLGLTAIALVLLSKSPKSQTPPVTDVPADPTGNKSNFLTTGNYCCPDNCTLQGKTCKCYNANGQPTYQPASICKGGGAAKKKRLSGKEFNAKVFGFKLAA